MLIYVEDGVPGPGVLLVARVGSRCEVWVVAGGYSITFNPWNNPVETPLPISNLDLGCGERLFSRTWSTHACSIPDGFWRSNRDNKQKIGNEKAEGCRYLQKEYQLARTLLKNDDSLAFGFVMRVMSGEW